MAAIVLIPGLACRAILAEGPARKALLQLPQYNPQYKQDQEELRKIDASLESETQALRAKTAARNEEQLRTNLDRTAGLEARLNSELAQMTGAAPSAAPKLQCSSDLANDITRMRNPHNTVDEQLQNQTLEVSAPGTAHLAEAAVSPSHSANAGAVCNALLPLFGFIGLGLVAAVIARKLHAHVYVASDVEQLLGQGPMAQLPDFDEVSEEVAEEYLLRLASSIAYACEDGQLRRFVFTGTGPGVGVSTIVTRVKEILAVLGREAVLIDAAGPAQAGALMPHTSRRTPSAREALMLTDTAPLTISAETEYTARRADCTILVIESAKTTRAQLRAVARSLRRLNPAVVGFVLNRVSLKNADQSFRKSLSEVERHLRAQGRTVERTVAQISRVVPEAMHASPVQEIPAPAEPAAAVIAAPAAPPARQAAPEPVVPQWLAPQRSTPQRSAPDRDVVAPPPLPQPAPVVAENREAQFSPQPGPAASAAPREVESVFPWFAGSAPQPALKPPRPLMPSGATTPSRPPMPSRPRIEEPMPQPAPQAPPPPAQQPMEDTPEWLMETPPWWMTKTHACVDPATEQPCAPRVNAWYAAPAPSGRKPAAAELREEENLPDEMPTRLSALRGIPFSMGVREFNPGKDAARDGDGNGSGRGVPANAAPFDARQTVIPEVLIPQPEQEPVEAKGEETAARTAASHWVTGEPEFLSPPAEETNKLKESRWNRGSLDDDIQILPSRPGQYKR
jgi:Mrp family chromosome partitioning ATPase